MTKEEYRQIQTMFKEVRDIEELRKHLMESDESKISFRFHTRLPRGGNMTSGDIMLSRSLTVFVFGALRNRAEQLKKQLDEIQLVSTLPIEELLPDLKPTPEPDPEPEPSPDPESPEEDGGEDGDEDNDDDLE